MSDLGWYDRTQYDKKQNQRLDELSSQLSHQRSEAGRLQARLAQVQGDLQGRLNGLASAFDAFVELCDLREELRAYQPVADARNRARRVVGRLIATGRDADLPVLPPPADPTPELEDYWLPRALASLVARVQGDGAAADAALAEARERDAARTDLFLCLAFTLTEWTDEAAGLLPGLLDLQPDRAVTRAQRELWLAAAAGRLGDQGRDAVAERLSALVAGLAEAQRTAQSAAWHGLVAGVGADLGQLPGVPSSAADVSGLVSPLRAARQIDALAAWYAQAAHPAPVDRPVPEAGDTQAPQDPPDPLYALLKELVDEGVPDEQPLLARMVQLRRTIEADGGAPAAAPPRWDAPTDAPPALLLADASGEPERRAVAARAARPLLAGAAAELVATASRPLPNRIEARVGRHMIAFTPTGADPTSVAAARDATLAPPPPEGRGPTQAGGALLAAGAAAIVVGLVLAAPLVFGAGVALAVVGGALLSRVYVRRYAAREAASRQATEWARTEERIAGMATAFGSLWAQAVQAAPDAAAARARFEEQLASEDPAPAPVDAH